MPVIKPLKAKDPKPHSMNLRYSDKTEAQLKRIMEACLCHSTSAAVRRAITEFDYIVRLAQGGDIVWYRSDGGEVKKLEVLPEVLSAIAAADRIGGREIDKRDHKRQQRIARLED